MLKKFLIIFIIIFVPIFSLPVFASNSDIGILENTIFGYDYPNDSDSKRIERLEKHLYGEKKSGNISKRVSDIKNDIGYSAPQNLQSTPSIPQINDKLYSQMNQKPNTKPVEKTALKEDASVEYPMVDKMEQALFNTKYKNEDIYSRLNRLEMKVYNRTTNDDLNTRVDRLASVIAPSRNNNNSYDSMYSSSDMDSYYSNSGLEPINDQSMPFQLAALEEDLLKNSYMNDNNSNRLGRLEQKLFKRNFPNDSDITRLQRVMVAYDAKKNSYKYENNRKMQNMATVSQIGGILLMILAILL